MSAPTKFVGPVYDEPTAKRLGADHGWTMFRDGAAWRRVVPSPDPVGIVELDMILLLADNGALVICAGGGGVPVTRDVDGGLHGVEAVVDKDLTAALLATVVGADALLILSVWYTGRQTDPPRQCGRVARHVVPGRVHGAEG
ncbi:MAG TPA: hypothetical protein VK817_23730 [Trebonia sp.]|nr:hypothetical protein [Trebonia sp.]